MAKKNENKISKTERQLMDGIAIVKAHPLFGRLKTNTRNVGKTNWGKDIAAKVRYYGGYWYDGDITLNKDCDRTPAEWAHIIAHCMLHLCFGHFDAERMPGYYRDIPNSKNGEKEWYVDCDPALWNMACDIYVERFLADVKFGAARVLPEDISRCGTTASELKIYDNLVRNNITAKDNIFGTAGEFPDMELDKPIVYKGNSRNAFVDQFAYALADSVRTVINAAGNVNVDNSKQSVMQMSALWFINHYPLLGGLASGFKIVDTRTQAGLNDISIAAINVIDGEIYVNQAAGLNFEEWKFVLAHEYLHAGLQHHERRQGRDFELWNVACDFVINGWLKEMNIGQMPTRGLLYDEELKNMSAEEIYDEIVKNLKKYSKLEGFRGYGKGDIIADGWRGQIGGPTTLDEFCKNALRAGLEYHESAGRGFIPEGLIEEIKALSMPPIPWDVQLGEWFDINFAPLEKRRTYARPSRRQSSTPDIPRPSFLPADVPENSRTYAAIIDTSGSMNTEMIGLALGAAASYSVAKEVPRVRVVFCDAAPYDIGYISPEDIAGRVEVKGRGGTVLQPAVDLLEQAKDFPDDAPILIITDGYIENDLKISREHAFLLPEGNRLPFRARGKVFYFKLPKIT